jgi:hypothetical protein
MKYKTTKKIRDIIDKLQKKHLIFIFNPLVQNNKSARTTSICDNSLSYNFRCYVPYVSIELLPTTFLVLGRFRNR